MLKSTTSCTEIAATVGGAYISSGTMVNEDATFNKKGVIASTAVGTATTGLNTLQDYRAYKTLHNAQAYIESMSSEELETFLVKLENKEETINTQEKAKQIVKTRV